jgi:superfamily II DNA or RNA helicase
MISTWTQRQIDINRKWFNTGMKGLLVAYTAFGKSSGISIPIIQEYKPKNLIIVVPTLRLKEDWELKLKKNNLEGIVLVINTAIKNIYECDLLIIDEIHRAASIEFIKVFDSIKYTHILGLTASIERSDGRHSLILEKLPILDNVSLEEGLEKGWIDPFECIKIPIELNNIEKTNLNKLNDILEDLKSKLGSTKPMQAAKFYKNYLNLNKWCYGNKTGKVHFIKTLENEIGKEKLDALFDKYFIRPDKTHPYFIKSHVAKKYLQNVGKRAELLYNVENKLYKTLELLQEYEEEYKFVFAQRIEFLEKLGSMLPENTFGLYHSKMTKKDKNKSFEEFVNDDGIKTLLSAKSLVEGVDIPKLSISIVTSYTSTMLNKIQTFGRTMRKYKNKRAVIIYLYVPLTQEQVWLDKLKLNN